MKGQKLPFYLHFAPVAVHDPTTPSAKTKGTSKAGPYGDWIHELDLSVGQLLDALDAQGLAKNTLVIFTSDNGGKPHPNSINAGLEMNKPWRGVKAGIHQGGFRVPFIVRWPGKVAAGTACDEPVSLVDVLATTAAATGQTLPPAKEAAEDSHNLLPLLLGEKTAKPVHPEIIVHSADGIYAIRNGPWKWVEGIPDGSKKKAEPALYNLAEDPRETRDVSKDHPEISEELSKRLGEIRSQGFSRE